MKNKFSMALSLALILALVVNSLALADNVQNDVVVGGNDTITAGTSTTINYRITANNGDGQTGCNAADASPATITINTPASVTVDTSGTPGNQVTLTFTTCGTNQSAVFTSNTPGTYLITVSVSDTGAGSYNVNPATFTLKVLAPADSTPPAITPNITGTLGNNGWYVSDVNLSWTIVDPESAITASSGCGSTTVNADTGGTTFTCSATSAGGSNSQSVTIKRDATAPAISGAASPAPNGAGWNNTDVNVTFSCSDGMSGVASCGPNQTLSNNGADQSASGNAVDNAGNSASATVSNIDIDKELPSITASVPAANGNGWYNAPVTASFDCSDAYSGVATCADDYTFTGEGSGQSHTGQASDYADNQNSTNVSVNIDATAPQIALVNRTPANGNGWNNSDVTLEWSCTDTGSGVVASSIINTLTAEGAGQSSSATCEDLAGNTATDTQTSINIDKTAPAVGASASPAANGNGWNNSNVTVTFSGTDALSGVATCDAPAVLSSEGAGQSASGACTDLAGNSASASVTGINIDKTAPTVGASAAPVANGNGWNNTDVTVIFSGTDALSGIAACDAPAVLSGEGAGQSASGACTDMAGNSATAGVTGINIDKTAPAVGASASPVANGNGWNNTDVTVTFSGPDGLSGIAACDAPAVLSSEGAGQSASGACTDMAGNSASAGVNGINIDKTAPTANAVASPVANAFGWNNTDVTVSFTGSDALSGIDTCSPAAVLTVEGAGQSASGSCTDLAGNLSAPATASNINIDKTIPMVALVGGPTHGTSYYFGFVPVAPACSASDALSGLAAACSVSGYDTSLGSHTVIASATDKADNSASTSATYTVLGWTLNGFYQPVDMNANVWNTVRNGSTVPLKFEIFAGTMELTNTSYIQSLQAFQVMCTGGGEDAIETVSTGSTSLRYDSTSGQFIFNWQTPRKAGNCYKVVMTTLDGSSLTAYFKLK